MASPAFVAAGSGQTTTAATSHTLNLPGGSGPSAGNLLLVLYRFAAAPGTITFTGYTSLNGASGDSSDATDDTTIVFYRLADGTEGTTDICSTVNSVKSCSLVAEISGAEDPATQAPEISTVAVGTTTANSANPSSRSVTGGPKDVIYFAMMGQDGELNEPNAPPTNYTMSGMTNNSGTAGAVATNCTMGMAWRQVSASSSDDPGTFTHLAAANGWTAYTVVVHPAAPVTFQPRPSGVDFADPGVLMKGIRRTWHRRRSGIFVPDLEGVFA